MPRQKGVTQLETLRRKQAEIAEQLQAAEAREREKEKRNDARRKELLGSLIAEQLRTDPKSSLTKNLIELIAQKLTKPADRSLFSDFLPPLPAKEKSESDQAS